MPRVQSKTAPKSNVLNIPKIDEVSKTRCHTGIPELDTVLGGGFPTGAVILVTGNSGTGKTIFSLEWLFNGVNQFNENGVYVTFTEPLFKTLKNLEGMSYYNRDIIEKEKIKILDIRKEIGKTGFKEQKILELIEKEVKKNAAQRLVIDSITAFAYNLQDKSRIRRFIFDLGTMLATLGCTTILTSEVSTSQYSVYGVEEFISDGILVFKQQEQKFQVVRTLEVAKMRGIKCQSGINAFRITTEGIKLFPQLKVPLTHTSGRKKISIGVKGLDSMALGGIYEGSSSIIAGSTGSGKSVLGLHFIWKGLMKNEPCLLAGFEESRDQILRNAKAFGFDFEKYEKSGLLKIMCAYPSEKYIEEHLLNIKDVIDSMNVKRCVIDSLSSIGNSFVTSQFRYFVKRLNAYLKSKVVTSLFTTATASLLGVEKLTEAHLSTMTDNIILLKYVEAGGEMKLMASVLKTRGDDHSKSLREYAITKKGIVIGETFKGFESVMTGSARKVSTTTQEQLRKVFTEHLGPIGMVEFNELRDQGQIREEGIISFVDSMIQEGSLNHEKGSAMKAKIHAIFGTAPGFGEAEETKSNIKETKQSLFSRLLKKEE